MENFIFEKLKSMRKRFFTQNTKRARGKVHIDRIPLVTTWG